MATVIDMFGTANDEAVMARAGFATADRKTYSTLGSLRNHGLFRAGALLIGSHAFGVLLNVPGVKAVPVPERFAIHKLMVSQLRGTASSKAEKDLQQAATLPEAVAERFPGAIEDALSAVPKSAGRYLRRAIPALKRHLPVSAEAVWDVLRSRI